MELHLQGGLGTVLAPCEEVDHSPILAYSPCVVVAVLDIETCLDLVVDAASSREGRSGSAAVQWKGLWEHRCQISLHLRLMRDAQDSHQLSGTQTDLMVVPCFLLHLGGEAVVEDTGRIVARTRLDNALMEVRHRNQTAVCWYWQIAGRSVVCRSRQMIALMDVFTQKMFFTICDDFGTQAAANLTARILLHLGP